MPALPRKNHRKDIKNSDPRKAAGHWGSKNFPRRFGGSRAAAWPGGQPVAGTGRSDLAAIQDLPALCYQR